MKQIQPWFYDPFHCIAQACSDTCCAGWAVYIDQTSLARYQADDSQFGQYRQSKILKGGDGAQFVLDDQGRCPFLTQENLCAMILQQGEDSLCHICTHHPRFYNTCGGYEMQGIGLCCPEGSRLLLSAPLRFHCQELAGEEADDPLAETLFGLQTLLQEVLLDTALPFENRCDEAMAIARQAQEQVYGVADVVAPVKQKTLYQTLLTAMTTLLPITPEWQVYVEDLAAEVDDLVAGEAAFFQSPDYDPNQYGDMAAYILYRQFPESLWDGEVVARLRFALLSMGFVHLCYLSHWLGQGGLSQEDKAFHLKNWSKQVEYCEENTTVFLNFCKADGILGQLY